jgi:Ras family
LEFTRQLGASQEAGIELWDCSGDHAYESCWPAVIDGVQGVIALYDVTSKTQESECRVWLDTFCKAGSLQTGQIMAIGIGDRDTPLNPLRVSTPHGDVTIPCLQLAIAGLEPSSDPSSAEHEFDSFVASVLQSQ